MIDYLIYGKIILDDLKLADGTVARNLLGGGGPQAAFGARLWHDSVGFLSRSGIDLDPAHTESLQKLGIDLAGWHLYHDIPTPYNRLYSYDDDEYLQTGDGELLSMAIDQNAWEKLLSKPLTLPPTYLSPKSIHLITEFFDEPMVETALHLRRQGALFSLEPIIDYVDWKNLDGLFALLQQVDIVTPDWPSASGIAKSDAPVAVLAYWSELGPEVVVIRHGHHGAYAWSKSEDQMWHVPVLPVNVLDPTGAGNSFGGGLLIGWSETRDVRLAGCYATISARHLVERVGIPGWSSAFRVRAHTFLDELMPKVVPLG